MRYTIVLAKCVAIELHELADGILVLLIGPTGAVLSAWEGGPAFRGLDGVSGDSADDDLTVLTNAPTPTGAGETILRLYVDRDERTPERGLTAVFAEWRGTAVGRLEIDARVTGLQIRYRSSLLAGAAWSPSPP